MKSVGAHVSERETESERGIHGGSRDVLASVVRLRVSRLRDDLKNHLNRLLETTKKKDFKTISLKEGWSHMTPPPRIGLS